MKLLDTMQSLVRSRTGQEWAILTGAGGAASMTVLPYMFATKPEILQVVNERRKAAGKREMSLPAITLMTAAQGTVQCGLMAALGLRLGHDLGLGAPRLESALEGHGASLSVPESVSDLVSGAAGAMLIAAIDRTLFAGEAQRLSGMNRPPGRAAGLVATAYGAITEEILLRFGLQTILAAIIRNLRHEPLTQPSDGTLWTAIALSSLLFGAGHLPAVRMMAGLTPRTVARVVLLNGILGVLFGYLYWQRGLEDAMLAHAGADLTLHVGLAR